MPMNSPVKNAYSAMRDKGYSKGKAARIAQSATGLSLLTGKPPKRRKSSAGAGGAARAAQRFHDREHDEASITA